MAALKDAVGRDDILYHPETGQCLRITHKRGNKVKARLRKGIRGRYSNEINNYDLKVLKKDGWEVWE